MAADPFAELLSFHLRRYPEMELLDVYKLLHQGAFGEGHTITNRKTAREWLDHEVGLITPDANVPLIESVHPEGKIVRLSLRAYLAARGNVTALLDAYIKAADAVMDGAEAVRAQQMAVWWSRFSQMLRDEPTLGQRFELRSAALIGRTRSAEQWPTTPHSPRYLQVYKPFYRVLTRDIADGLIKQQAI